jgi:hypothetical protein
MDCQVAARTLGDLVKKLGERVLPEIIPILEKGLDSERADQRQGVCIGLSEIMKATSREHVSEILKFIYPQHTLSVDIKVNHQHWSEYCKCGYLSWGKFTPTQ